MPYLETLAKHGIRASVRSGNILWLEPRSAITDDIRTLALENKAAIMQELQEASAPTPSTEHLFPRDGCLPSTLSVAPEAVAQVDAIREEAMQLGWTEAGLYQNRGRYPFPYGQEYGLVCFLSGARQVGEVTACIHRDRLPARARQAQPPL